MTRDPGTGRGARTVYIWITAVASVATLSTAVALNWLAANSVADFQAGPQKLTAPAAMSEYAATTQLSVRGSVGTLELVYRGQGGTVTQVMLTASEPIMAGAALIRVDGVAVTGWVGETTFYRDLAVDSRGDDVRELQTQLIAAGYLSESADGRFGSATSAAVKRFQTAIGEARPDGAFRTGYVVRLAADRLVPSTVLAQQDSRIAPGDVIAEIRALDAGMQVQASRSVPKGEYTVSIAGATFPATLDDNGWALHPPDDLDLTTLVTDDEGPFELQGSARQTDDAIVLSIPPAALVSDADGSSCVVRVRVGEQAEIVPVTIAGASLSGAVLVAPGEQLAVDDQVDLRPAERSCR